MHQKELKKSAESAGALDAYIYLVWMLSSTFRMEHLFLPYIRKMLAMKEPHTALFVAPMGVEKTHLALNLLESMSIDILIFNSIVILCTTV